MVDVCVSVFFKRITRFFESSSSCDLTNDIVFCISNSFRDSCNSKTKSSHDKLLLSDYIISRLFNMCTVYLRDDSLDCNKVNFISFSLISILHFSSFSRIITSSVLYQFSSLFQIRVNIHSSSLYTTCIMIVHYYNIYTNTQLIHYNIVEYIIIMKVCLHKYMYTTQYTCMCSEHLLGFNN